MSTIKGIEVEEFKSWLKEFIKEEEVEKISALEILEENSETVGRELIENAKKTLGIKDGSESVLIPVSNLFFYRRENESCLGSIEGFFRILA